MSEENPFALETTDAGAAAIEPVGRAAGMFESEIKAAITVAVSIPRKPAKAYERLMEQCDRRGFAEKCEYSFRRGGSRVTGPTVGLARQAAAAWGNIRYGLDVIEDTAERRRVEGWAWDMETNTKVTQQDDFQKVHERKDPDTGVTSEVPVNERELRELTNKRGAVLVRNCILQLLPVDLVDAALERASATKKAGAKKDLARNRKQVTRDLIDGFSRFSVTSEMLEEHLGHPLETMDEEELAELRGIWNSLRDGNTKRGDHFGKGESVERADEQSEEYLPPDEDGADPEDVKLFTDEAPA